MTPMMYKFEQQWMKKGYNHIAGVDEAGRGPLAGPVVAACVILNPNHVISGLNDSKKLTDKRRRQLKEEIKEHALAYQIAFVDEKTIDKINIYQASRRAMEQAILDCPLRPDAILSDAMPLNLDIPTQAIIKGDQLSISIAAASIVAKVTRDRMMDVYAGEYPEYDFAANKGYPTQTHKSAIKAHGASPIHRMSFKGVAAFSSP